MSLWARGTLFYREPTDEIVLQNFARSSGILLFPGKEG